MLRVGKVRVVLAEDGELLAVTGITVRLIAEKGVRVLLGESVAGERWLPADEVLID